MDQDDSARRRPMRTLPARVVVWLLCVFAVCMCAATPARADGHPHAQPAPRGSNATARTRLLRAVARRVVARRARQLARVGQPTLAVGMSVGLAAGIPGVGSTAATAGVIFNRRSPRTGRRHLVTPYVSMDASAGVGARAYVNLRDPREHGVERLAPGFGRGNSLVGGKRAIASAVFATGWMSEQGAGVSLASPTPFAPHVYPGLAVTTEVFVLSPRFARAVAAGTQRAKAVWQRRVQPPLARGWAVARPVVQPAYAHTLQPGVRWAREHVARPLRARRERHAAGARAASAVLPIARAAARVTVPAARVVTWPVRAVRDAAARTLAPYIDELATESGDDPRGKATAAP